jgi:predicted Fe-Mo cluster-binding NifX family protein
MKILMSTSASGIDAPLDPRFGRCGYFLVVDLQTRTSESLPNPALTSSGGAGIQAAQLATQRQVSAVISGDFGPNAYEALAAAGIDMYKYGNCSTVQEVIERFSAGQLEKISGPGRAGHHGR